MEKIAELQRQLAAQAARIDSLNKIKSKIASKAALKKAAPKPEKVEKKEEKKPAPPKPIIKFITAPHDYINDFFNVGDEPHYTNEVYGEDDSDDDSDDDFEFYHHDDYGHYHDDDLDSYSHHYY